VLGNYVAAAGGLHVSYLRGFGLGRAMSHVAQGRTLAVVAALSSLKEVARMYNLSERFIVQVFLRRINDPDLVRKYPDATERARHVVKSIIRNIELIVHSRFN